MIISCIFKSFRTRAGGIGTPAKAAIGTVVGLVVLAAIIGTSVYFGLAGENETIYHIAQKVSMIPTENLSTCTLNILHL